MKIFIKSLKGDKTEFDVAPEDTVESLKQKIQDSQGHAIDLQKLIAFGRIMEGPKLLSEYNLKENDNIVLMVSKPKPPPRVQAEPVPPQPAATSTVPLGAASKPGAAPGGTSPVLSPPQAVLQGPEYEANVQRIMELGMPRDQVEAALRAARGHPDLAMEFLLNGIPPTLAAGHQHVHQHRPAAQAANPPAAGDNPFAFLRNNPAMLQLRATIQQNPALLQSLVQQIATTNPQLARLIMQHPTEFRDFMMETGPQVDPGLVAALPRPGAPAQAAVAPRASAPAQMQLTAEETAAIDNLASLGFSKRDAMEAYLSCDKNEAMAANLLFENYDPLVAQEDERLLRATQAASSSAAPAAKPVPEAQPSEAPAEAPKSPQAALSEPPSQPEEGPSQPEMPKDEPKPEEEKSKEEQPPKDPPEGGASSE